MPSVSRDTATQRINEGPVESFSEDLDGGYTVNFARFRPDMDSTPLLKGAPGDRCQCPHWGYVLEASSHTASPDTRRPSAPAKPSTCHPATSRSATNRTARSCNSAPPKSSARSKRSS
jgi:hypothetical protein